MNVMFKKLSYQGYEYWICTLNGVEVARANSEEGVRNRLLFLIKNSKRDKEEAKLAIKLV